MKTKNTTYIIAAMLAVFTVFGQGCKDDKGPTDLNIESMTVAGVDLNGATAPTDVSVSPSIVITFNTDIDATTANASNITLVQDYDQTNIELTISADGPVLTVAPASELGSGTLYTFTITAGLLNSDEQPLTQTVRTFTTAGTFSPSGMIANWTFENTSDDIVGNYDPATTGVVDITYTASRNEAAGTAATFNGTTSIIEIPNGDQLITTDEFSMSFWVKTNSEGIDRGHFVFGLGAFYGLQYEIFGSYDGSKFAIRYEIANDPDSTTAEDMWFPSNAVDNTSEDGWQGWDYAKSLTPEQMQSYLKDTWTMITLTYDGVDKKARMYFNDELMKSYDFDLWPDGDAKQSITGMTYAGVAPEVVNELAFGFIQSRAGTLWDGESWGGYDFPEANHFKGQLDDIKFYHKVLSDTEIQLMYNSEK